MCIELVANRFLRRVIILLNVLDARFFFFFFGIVVLSVSGFHSYQI